VGEETGASPIKWKEVKEKGAGRRATNKIGFGKVLGGRNQGQTGPSGEKEKRWQKEFNKFT